MRDFSGKMVTKRACHALGHPARDLGDRGISEMGQHRSRDASFVVPADDISVAKRSNETGKYPGAKGGLEPSRLVGAFFQFHEHEHERSARVLESLALD